MYYDFLTRDANRIGDVVVSVLASSVVDRGFESCSGHTIGHKICICCFTAKHTVLTRNQTCCLGIRIMCPSGATCISVEESG